MEQQCRSTRVTDLRYTYDSDPSSTRPRLPWLHIPTDTVDLTLKTRGPCTVEHAEHLVSSSKHG